MGDSGHGSGGIGVGDLAVIFTYEPAYECVAAARSVHASGDVRSGYGSEVFPYQGAHARVIQTVLNRCTSQTNIPDAAGGTCLSKQADRGVGSVVDSEVADDVGAAIENAAEALARIRVI